MVGQFGVAMWNTSANVLLSDVTTSQNRGKVLAVRHMSMRMGFVAGPLVGGVMAVTFGLQSVFLLNGLSKIIILLVAFFLVRETRPTQASAPAPAEGKPARSALRFSLAPFRDPSFLALSVATAALSMTQAGTMQAVLPVHAKDALGVSSASLGFLISLAAALAFALALPNGVLSDRLGRKVSLVPGLALLGVSVLALAYGQAYGLLVLVVVLHGSGEAMTLGTTQTYAMDLAPSTARGAFMGLWSLSQSIGAVIGPLAASALYHWVSPAAAFQAVAGVLLVSAVVMLVMGRETAGPWARRPVDD
jgi:MFS family permease